MQLLPLFPESIPPSFSNPTMNSLAKKWKNKNIFERKATTSIYFKVLIKVFFFGQNLKVKETLQKVKHINNKVKCCIYPRSTFCELILKILNVQFGIYFSNPFWGCWFISHHIWFVEGLLCSQAQGQLHLHYGFIMVLCAPAQQNWQTENKNKQQTK